MNGSDHADSADASYSTSANPRTAFATSSSDFALPFGSSASSSASSGPISIPSRPFPSSSNSAAAPPLLSLSGALASSPLKLASSSGTGLGIGMLPSPSTRDHANPLAQPQLSLLYAQPASPTLSLAGEGWPPPPFTSLSSASSATSPGAPTASAALLRRSQGMNSPGFAIASPARFRRASMLGREITPFHLDPDPSEQEQDFRASANPDDGDDEMMQDVEDEDMAVSRAPSTPVMGPPLSLANTPNTPPPTTHPLGLARHSTASSALARASTSDSGQDSSSSASGAASALGHPLGGSTSGLSRTVPRSPSTGASMGSPLGHAGNRSRSSSLLSSNVVRKAVTRRANLLPRDRSVLRVAASLQDESKPEDSEIASEAKLQKRLGGEATLPRTPRFGPSSGGSAFGSAGGSGTRMSKSPFFGAAGGFGSISSSRRKYMWDDDVDDIRGVFTADGLDDADSSDLSSEEEEMMMYYSRTGSLSDEEDELRSRPPATTLPDATPSTPGSHMVTDAARHEAHAAGGGAMSLGGAGGGAGPSSLPKRKGNALWMGFRDRGNAHKWSPGGSTGSGAAVGGERGWRRAAAGGGAGGGMDVDTSPRVLGAAGGARLSKRKTVGDDRYEPYKRRAVSPMNLGSSLGSSAVASASTAQVAAGSNSPLMMPISSPSGGILYRGIHAAQYHAYTSRYSTSPTISRPCTPVARENPQPPAAAAFSPAASGSGPGYGSGALGLSISANPPQSVESRVQLEQQHEIEALMDQRVGMLGLS